MKRQEFTALIGSFAIAWPLASHAQQPLPPPKRVGLISTADTPCPIPSDHPIRRRLAELGWIADQNIVFDCVSTVGRIDQGPAIARELVSRRPDVLMEDVYFYVSALMQETATIPIVMLSRWEPMRLGHIASFARPGGNVTGVAWFALHPRQMELLKEIVPSLRRVAYIYDADEVAAAKAAITPTLLSKMSKILDEERGDRLGAAGHEQGELAEIMVFLRPGAPPRVFVSYWCADAPYAKTQCERIKLWPWIRATCSGRSSEPLSVEETKDTIPLAVRPCEHLPYCP
jgi:putative ABC transport system substrate-binding protein